MASIYKDFKFSILIFFAFINLHCACYFIVWVSFLWLIKMGKNAVFLGSFMLEWGYCTVHCKDILLYVARNTDLVIYLCLCVPNSALS